MLFPTNHDESSRLAVSACACVRAFARSGASKFWEPLKVPFLHAMFAFFTEACLHKAEFGLANWLDLDPIYPRVPITKKRPGVGILV